MPARLPAENVDRFAELLADEKTPAQAGRALGLTVAQTATYWRRIKKDLGAQAR